MKKYLLIISVVLAGCASGETQNRGLYSGQWTPVQSLGVGKYLIQGYDTSDAIKGATVFCNKSNKTFVADSVTPHQRNERATVTFICQ